MDTTYELIRSTAERTPEQTALEFLPEATRFEITVAPSQ